MTDFREKRVSAQEAVNSIENIAGIYPGYRRAHARGTCFKAIFQAGGRAEPLSSSLLFQEGEYECTVRFSHSAPNPFLPDVLSVVQGMAVRFNLPDGLLNLVTVTIPVFFAKTPESFLELMQTAARTIKTRAVSPQTLASLIKRFPETKNTLSLIQAMDMPASFAASRYYSIHAYYLVSANGRKQPVKFEWEPAGGLEKLTKEEAADMTAHYLDEELTERLQSGPISFHLDIQLGKPEDPTDDPTVAWPSDRQKIRIGTLTIIEETDPEPIMFDTKAVPQGIMLSEDKILQFRSGVYAESAARRDEKK